MKYHWFLNSVKDDAIRWEAREIVLKTAIDTANAAKRLGWPWIEHTDIPTQEISQPHIVVDFANGFKLRVGKSLEDNFIDLDTLEGGGSIEATDLHLPLLMLLACQKKLNERGIRAPDGPDGKDLLVLADEAGDVKHFPNWDAMTSLLDAVNPDDQLRIRELAVEIGLVPPIISLATLQTNVEDCYF